MVLSSCLVEKIVWIGFGNQATKAKKIVRYIAKCSFLKETSYTGNTWLTNHEVFTSFRERKIIWPNNQFLAFTDQVFNSKLLHHYLKYQMILTRRQENFFLTLQNPVYIFSQAHTPRIASRQSRKNCLDHNFKKNLHSQLHKTAGMPLITSVNTSDCPAN